MKTLIILALLVLIGLTGVLTGCATSDNVKWFDGNATNTQSVVDNPQPMPIVTYRF